MFQGRNAHRIADFAVAQLAVYACGNALAIVLGVVLYNVWIVLSDFRDPMLWALLCSVALRDAKNYSVKVLDEELGKRNRCGAG